MIKFCECGRIAVKDNLCKRHQKGLKPKREKSKPIRGWSSYQQDMGYGNNSVGSNS